LKDIAFIRTTEQMTTKDAKSLREEFQYGTETTINEKLLSEEYACDALLEFSGGIRFLSIRNIITNNTIQFFSSCWRKIKAQEKTFCRFCT